MRALITSAYGSKGDVIPFFRLAVEMRSRGHEVFLFVSEAQYDFIKSQRYSNEIEIIEIKGNFNGVNNWAPGTSATLKERAENIVQKWLSTLRVLYHALDEKVDPGRTVVVSHPLNFASRMLQEKKLIPNISVVLQPWLLRSVNRVPKSEPQLLRDCYPQCAKQLIYYCMDKVSDSHFLPEINSFAEHLDINKVCEAILRRSL